MCSGIVRGASGSKSRNQKRDDMKNWIKNFLNDERGAESTELAITAIVVAGGAVSKFDSIKNKVGEKVDDVLDKLDDATGV